MLRSYEEQNNRHYCTHLYVRKGSAAPTEVGRRTVTVKRRRRGRLSASIWKVSSTRDRNCRRLLPAGATSTPLDVTAVVPNVSWPTIAANSFIAERRLATAVTTEFDIISGSIDCFPLVIDMLKATKASLTVSAIVGAAVAGNFVGPREGEFVGTTGTGVGGGTVTTVVGGLVAEAVGLTIGLVVGEEVGGVRIVGGRVGGRRIVGERVGVGGRTVGGRVGACVGGLVALLRYSIQALSTILQTVKKKTCSAAEGISVPKGSVGMRILAFSPMQQSVSDPSPPKAGSSHKQAIALNTVFNSSGS